LELAKSSIFFLRGPVPDGTRISGRRSRRLLRGPLVDSGPRIVYKAVAARGSGATL